MSIEVNNNIIEFDWYTKPTFSGRVLNFFSRHSNYHKRGIIYGLEKVLKLFYPRHLQKNLNRAVELLLMNNYLLNYIFHNMRNRVKNFIFLKTEPPILHPYALPLSFLLFLILKISQISLSQ